MSELKQGKLKIVLMSDLICGSGAGFSNIVDNDIVFDSYGIPYIPARRLRGILREAAYEYGLMDDSKKDLEEKIFGNGEDSRLVLYNATFMDLDQIHYEIRNANPKYQKYLSVSNVLNSFTSIRHQTKIDDDGIAEENSLRSSRVINKGNVFYADIQYCQEDEEDIQKCLKFVRHMGVSRTRGFGEIQIGLEPAVRVQVETLTIPDFEDNKEYEIKLCVTNQSQLSILGSDGDKTLDYIPGSSVLGYYANAFLKKNSVDQKTFNELFLKGNVQFGNGYISDDDWNEYIPVKKSIYKEKTADIYYDKSLHSAIEEGKIIQSVHDKYISYEPKDKIYIKEVDKEMVYHHRRPLDKSIGHVVSNEGDMGLFYQNEVICANQRFIIPIRGKGRYLKQVFTDPSKYIQIGRSKNTQYGNVRIVSMQSKEIIPQRFYKGEDVIMTMLSPMLLINERCESVVDIQQLTDELGIQVTDKDKFVDYVRIGGYNSKWKLQKPSYIGFKEGSTFRGRLTKDREEHFCDGAYINEGLGQISITKASEEKRSIEKYSGKVQSGKMNSFQHIQNILLYGIKNEHHQIFIQWMFEQKQTNLTPSSIGRVLLMASKNNWNSFNMDIDGIAEDKKRNMVKEVVERIKKKCDEIIQQSVINDVLHKKDKNAYKNALYLDCCKYYFVHEKLLKRGE